MVKVLALVVAIFMAFLQTSEAKTLLCARCSSKTEQYEGQCENDPPPPTRCSGGSSVEQFCIIAKEYAKDGRMIGFIRDCSVTATEDKCRELNLESPKSPARICITSCGTPGCNGALRHAPPTAILFLGLLISLYRLISQ